jgi:type I restriction-modification system DNA methylase subunit
MRRPSLTGEGIIRQVYDPACGTGGMLALTEERMKEFKTDIRVELFGQELNGESFGICKSDMLVTGHDPENIVFGNTLTHDAHTFVRRLLEETIKQYQRDNSLQNIIMTNADDRNRIFDHLFSRALREVRETAGRP